MTLVEELARAVDHMAAHRRVIVGFDGPDAAGKTIMANRLAEALSCPTIRASIDGFHRRREFRIARGLDSPEGYYRDSFAYEQLEEQLFSPFARGESEVRTRVFDFRADSEVEGEIEHVPPECALVFDGVFLLRPELRRWWDVCVYLDVPEDVILARAVERDSTFFGSPEEVEARFRARYLPGQALYRQESRPEDAAHVLVDNSDAYNPVVMRWDIAARV